KSEQVRQKPPISADVFFARFRQCSLLQIRAVNTLAKLITLPLGAVFLAGCASTDFQPLESQGPVVAQGQWGTRKVVDGVDIWTTGAPPRKYRVLGVINDTRGAGP